jgi:hypothetical protein
MDTQCPFRSFSPGAAIWALACQIEAFFVSPQARTALMSAIVVFYSVLSAWEFYCVTRPATVAKGR